jgi:excisionase family DNA binding protein
MHLTVENEKYFSIKEFALKLNVHPNTIRRAIKSAKISALKIGSGKRSVYRIAYSEIGRMAKFDLEEYINKIIEQRK